MWKTCCADPHKMELEQEDDDGDDHKMLKKHVRWDKQVSHKAADFQKLVYGILAYEGVQMLCPSAFNSVPR